MEHLQFFELPADPFQNDADARFYYESAPQKRARLRLLRGVHQRKALSILVGGPGLGKTTLAHVLLRTLEEKDYAAHYLSIPHEACVAGWFLPNVARGFGVPMPSSEVPRLIEQIEAQLVALATARRAPVLLIDEAQLFRNRDAMEEFRGLLNLSHDGKKLLSLVLFGLHELNDLLKLDPPLAQRVEVRVERTAMDWLESQAYVSHRLRLAGASQAIFSPDALEALFRWSGGVPRVLNTLADNSMFEAYLTETRPVDSTVVQTAAEALGLFRVPSDSVPNIPPLAPPAPDLLASLAAAPAAKPAAAKLPPAKEPELDAPPTRVRMRTPEPEPAPEPEAEFELEPTSQDEAASEPALAAVAEELSGPDWLEPLSPMPEDVPVEEPAPEPLEAELELGTQTELDLDLDDVLPEDTEPPTRVAKSTHFTPADAKPAKRAAIPMPAPEPEPEDAEVALDLDGDDDEADLTFGSLVDESDDSEEEAALAGFGPADSDAEPDLAPVRHTSPTAKPSPLAPPVTPPKPVPVAKPTPAKPTPASAAPAKVAAKPATPAKAGPAIPTNNDDSFDLANLIAEDEADSGPAALKPPAKDGDDDDLDALFDEIQTK